MGTKKVVAKKSASKKASPKAAPAFVVVRTYSAGVHVGLLASRDGREVTLTGARRIWSWKGANTLHEMSLRGIDAARSRVSEPVESITLTEAIEVIPCTAVARECLEGAKWSA